MTSLHDKFMDFLLKKPATSGQARAFLEKACSDESVIDALMLEAEDAGLVDDGAYARLFVEGHLQWGNLKIAHELKMRGVSRGDIDEALSEAEDETERAREIAESLRKSGVEDRKIASRLMSRGFTKRAVRSAMG